MEPWQAFQEYGTARDAARLQAENARDLAKLPAPLRLGFDQATYDAVKEKVDDGNIRKQAVTDCTFNVFQCYGKFIRGVLAIAAAARDCNPKVTDLTIQDAKMACAVDLTGMVESMSDVAGAMSYAIGVCPEFGDNLSPFCSGDIATFIMAVAGMAQSFASFKLTCGEAVKRNAAARATAAAIGQTVLG